MEFHIDSNGNRWFQVISLGNRYGKYGMVNDAKGIQGNRVYCVFEEENGSFTETHVMKTSIGPFPPEALDHALEHMLNKHPDVNADLSRVAMKLAKIGMTDVGRVTKKIIMDRMDWAIRKQREDPKATFSKHFLDYIFDLYRRQQAQLAAAGPPHSITTGAGPLSDS